MLKSVFSSLPRITCAARQRKGLEGHLLLSTATHSSSGRTPYRAQSYITASNAIEEWKGYGVGIERAETLPASWYTSSAALQLEKQHVLYNTWQMVCDVGRLKEPGDFICGSLADVRYLIVKGQDEQLRAFHNVCRHHAAAVAHGCGNQLHFTCPYHGWTYDDRGRLVKATRLKGIQDFKASQYGLHPIAVDTWGHFVFIHLQGGKPTTPAPAAAATHQQQELPKVADWLGAGGQRLQDLGMSDKQLVHITRREYVLNCNWKVFCDNYLDGGYHVPYAHKDLASGLDLKGYQNELHEVMSIQRCAVQPLHNSQSSSSPSEDLVETAQQHAAHDVSSSESVEGPLMDRLGGRDAAYAFVYPNIMVNRYGPWMDTNVVVPYNGSSVDRCLVIFDYWLEADAVADAAASVQQPGPVTPGDMQQSSATASSNVVLALQSTSVQQSLASSHKVQEEDIALCEAVQLGLQEPAYGVGRYAPGPEAPMYHFHSLLYGSVLRASREQGNLQDE